MTLCTEAYWLCENKTGRRKASVRHETFDLHALANCEGWGNRRSAAGGGTPVLFVGYSGAPRFETDSRGQLSPHACSSQLLLSKEQVCDEEEGEYHRNYSVHSKEGGVHAREVVGSHKRVLVEQKAHDGSDADDR